MIRKLTFILALCTLLTAPILAKDLKLPNDDFAIASITVPNSWEPEAIDNGFEAESPDKAIYLAAVAVGSEKGLDAEIDDTFTFLKEHKVKLDQSTKKEQKFTVNGVEVDEIVFQGEDEDGKTTVSIAFFPMKNKMIVFTYWATTSEEVKHHAEIGKILDSLKPAGS